MREVDFARSRGHDVPVEVNAGIMLETPGIAWAIEHALPHADFVSVGANDLMQYFFAADRQNSRVWERYDILSPAALQLLKTIQEACKRHDVPVSICGEVASQPLEAAVMLALGYSKLSMAAGGVAPVKTTLARVDVGKLGTWLASHLGDDVPSLRPLLINAGKSAGIPREAVDKSASI